MRSFRVTLSFSSDVINPMHKFIGECEDVTWDRLLHGAVTDDDLDTFLFHVEGDRDAYVEALEGYSALRAYDVTPIDDDSFYVYIEQEAPEVDQIVFDAFSRSGVIVVPPIDFTGDGRARLTIVGDPNEVREVLADLPAGVETDVIRIGDYEGSPSVLSSLSERQLEALTAGVDVGYYEVPREGSVDDVGQRLGCAPGTAAEHLQKGESQVVTELIARREGSIGPDS